MDNIQTLGATNHANHAKPYSPSMLSCISLSVWADVVPNAGQLLQQQQMIPYQPQAAIELESATTVPPALASMSRYVLKIQITGNQSLSREVLHALVVDYEGKT